MSGGRGRPSVEAGWKEEPHSWGAEVATSVTTVLPQCACFLPCLQAGFRKLQGKTVLLRASLDQEDGKWERGKQVETGKGARGQWEGK